jgi:cellulose synthase/poly-beta-1,6-N-acetylglucosamine synthase-like glycosyltransferase
MSAFGTAAVVFAVIAGLPVAVVLLQTVAALLSGTRRALALGPRPKLAVLIPAHNEEQVVAKTVREIIKELHPGECLMVIADNCADRTAEEAARAGACVVVRRDESLRGKTHALEFGLSRLQPDPPEVVVIVDADCRLAPGSLDLLARRCAATARPTQSLYLMKAPAGAPTGTRIAAFAWIVKNWVRPLGMLRMGLPCQLMGSGVAIPWPQTEFLFRTGRSIAEDYKAGIGMAMNGAAPEFCPDARVFSEFPSNARGLQSQRTRWEHGHIDLIVRDVPKLVFDALRRRDVRLLAMAVDLAVPPLALTAVLVVLAVSLGFAAAWLGNPTWPLAASIFTLFALAATIGIAWVRWGRDTVSAASLLRAPLYAIGKIPLYLRFVTKRERLWIKTERD